MENIFSGNAIRDCTGCGMCSAVCPTEAISMTLSEDGFYVPALQEDKCIHCGKCLNACYKFSVNYVPQMQIDLNSIATFAAKNKDYEELRKSSSGAVSMELMRECIRQGYKVVGVAYDCNLECAVTRIASDYSDLEQFRGSKYFQSRTEDATKQIVSDCSNQKYAIFGTPCQIYAYSELAKSRHQSDRFLFVDIFCHGCPSFLLWKSYLSSKKDKYKAEYFDHISFRSKTNGWHEYCFDFTSDGHEWHSSKYMDSFYELFFSKNVMNSACYNCVARSSLAATDIRIGDYWGARYDKDTTGVSAIILCTDKGKKLFEKVKDKFEYESASFEEVIAAQSYGKVHSRNEKLRAEMLIWLKELPIHTVIRKYRTQLSSKARFKIYLKACIKHIPVKLYSTLRAKLHQNGK